jgi:hypothetical protein|tara:strand:+ start:419 stop:640 length:222 start_codon:yes stop_codon:yes gene_type:complete
MTEKLIKYGAGGKPMIDEKQTLIEVYPEVPEVTSTTKTGRKKKKVLSEVISEESSDIKLEASDNDKEKKNEKI